MNASGADPRRGAPAQAAGTLAKLVGETAPAPDGAPAKRGPGRAGRDLRAAVAVGAGMGAVVLVTLFAYRPAFVVVVVTAICYGLYELVQALRTRGARPPLTAMLVAAVGMLWAAYAGGAPALVVGLLLAVALAAVCRLAGGAAGAYATDLASASFALVYVPFLAGFAVLLLRPDDGPQRVVAFIATVVCSDVGGYAAGVLFGRHPMAPTVSPKKSWEGLAGSATACAIGGVAFLTLLLDGTWWQGVLFGLAVVCSATVGDLGESMVKRDLGIKDMGTLLPGHGGLMDRLDSLLPTAPVAWLLLSTFVPPT